jgi:exopolysaccharide biosynthesis WecB/TagA/CpsF family protein
MWLDFEQLVTVGDSGVAGLSFSRHRRLQWRVNWRAVVKQIHVTSDDAAKNALIDEFAGGVGARTLGFVNAHALNSAVTDQAFAADLLTLDHIVRDGVGINALYRMLGIRAGFNLNGTDLIPEIIARFAGKRVALFGTQLPIVHRAAARLRQDYGLDIVVADGFQPDGFYLKLAANARPDLIILGMGMPKQERVAHRLKHGLNYDVAIVCGGAILDFLSGHVPRAPSWMRSTGLEWAYRLSLEPKRLFRRYVIGNPLFLFRSAVLAVWPNSTRRMPPSLPERRPSTQAFGIGGPAPHSATDISTQGHEIRVPKLAAIPIAPAVQPVAVTAASVFSANRPVVVRDDLFGRQAELDRLIGWVLDQNGNALIYGPRGYGKTSLVRVLGEIADSRQHVVLYASGSRDISFDSLMGSYLAELADNGLMPAVEPGTVLTVQNIATRLAGIVGASVVLIIDEFDRIEGDVTRHSLIELIKDVSDLTAAVRFVLVGVATDATAILGYHPSIQRCMTSIALPRLSSVAIETLFTRKATIDGLVIGPGQVDNVVALAAGSAYHAQLIGQKLVEQARRIGRLLVRTEDLDHVIDAILSDAMSMDAGFARIARAMRDPAMRARLMALAMLALAGTDDVIVLPEDRNSNDLLPLCEDLVADAVLITSSSVRDADGYRFVNAFLPQLMMMIQYRVNGLPSVVV